MKLLIMQSSPASRQGQVLNCDLMTNYSYIRCRRLGPWRNNCVHFASLCSVTMWYQCLSHWTQHCRHTYRWKYNH